MPSPKVEHSRAMFTDRGREWVTYTDVAAHSDDFAQLGAAYEPTATLSRGRVGKADARLFPVAEAVAFAAGWLRANRPRRRITDCNSPARS